MTMPISSDIISRTLENFFGLYIGSEYDSTEGSNGNQGWTNPYLKQNSAFETPTLSVITPYIPGDNQQFSVTAPSEFWNRDIIAFILSKLDLKNLINSSSVCKSFYLASKTNFIWEVHLCNLLPKVTVIDRNLCGFTPEQQYKIIFKRIENERKPYIAKFNRNQELYQNRQNELEKLKLEFREAGGEDAASRFEQKFVNLSNQSNLMTQSGGELMTDLLEKSPDRPAHRLQHRITELQVGLFHGRGKNYDGTDKSIAPKSVQGEILNAIHVLVPNAFNNQDKFNLVIQKSVAAKNASSSNSKGATIKAVTDVAEPG